MRFLFLTNPDEIRGQLRGRGLTPPPQPSELMDRVSTDEIFPSGGALVRDLSDLPQFALAGLRGDCIRMGDLVNGDFSVLVAGHSFGCGSSREHAPSALSKAGIELVVARSVERIFFENCVNLGGPLVSTDLGLVQRLREGESIDRDRVVSALDELTQDILRAGGLLHYSRQRMAGKRPRAPIETKPRPMTTTEKILARHMSVRYGCVKPGDVGFVATDLRYVYELFQPMIQYLLRETFGEGWAIARPDTLLLFNDHLALLDDPEAERLRHSMREFARQHGLLLYDSEPPNGAEGICHAVVLERHARPGQVIVGTDSHTCTVGAIGALAFGIGATEMANALITGEVRVTVPQTIRFEFAGQPTRGVGAKDVMLHLLALPVVQEGRTVGKVLEYGGIGLSEWPLDELVVLTNMAVEAGAFTGLVDHSVLESCPSFAAVDQGLELQDDTDAEYAEVIHVDLSAVPLMIAEPGDPRNAVPLQSRHFDVDVDIAYVGSCTSGKLSDLAACADVLRGRQVNPHVKMYVQASSRQVESEARRLGLLDDIVAAGAMLLGPGCGACCGLGPGTSTDLTQVTISSTNRNYPGRMGKGQVYLASPAVVAASAVAGRIIGPGSLGVP